MAKKSKKPKSIIPEKYEDMILVSGTILLLLVLAFVFRGWFRVTVIPKADGVFYLGSINSELKYQSDQLSNPLSSLGFVNISLSKSCSLQVAQSIHTDVDCEAIQQSYAKLPSDLNNEVKTANVIQARLNELGWRGGSNGVTLNSLVDGIPQGKDYSPDAFYEKVINSDNCTFDIMIAYSNPQPPAIRGTFTCDRTLDFLGAPKEQTYFSSHWLN